jgi:hypothetical protein
VGKSPNQHECDGASRVQRPAANTPGFAPNNHYIAGVAQA